MKKIFLSLAFVAIAAASQAQSLTGSVKDLAKTGKAKIEFDYSKASIHGLTEQEFCNMFEHDYFKDKAEILEDFTEEFNEHLGGLLICDKRLDSPYTVVVKVLDVSRKGNTTCELHIMKKDADGVDQEIASVTGLKKRGGTYGTAMNLMKDGAEHVGQAAGSFMKTAMKKALIN